MSKLYLVLVSFLPGAAMAHPDHSQGAASLLHYFTGSHLVEGLLYAGVVYVGYRLLKRFMHQ